MRETVQQPAEGRAQAAPVKDKIRVTGVGLRESELAEFDAIAGDHGVSRNSLLRFACQHFLEQYRAGKVTLPIVEKRGLDLSR